MTTTSEKEAERTAAREASRAARERLGDADVLVARILEVREARSLALDALLRLSAVAWADDVATACVECSATPRLLLNPRFIEERCDTPQKLAFLLLHELAHVSLGHTGLHTRITAVQNVAFDAVINASLLQGMLQRGYPIDGWDALVVAQYDATTSPEFILRPPPEWPEMPEWEASKGAPVVLRKIHRRLYERRPSAVDDDGESDSARWLSVSYGEIVEALMGPKRGRGIGVAAAEGLAGRLLGAHGATARERGATSGGRDSRAAESLEEALVRLPRDAAALRGDGGDPVALRLQGERDRQLTVAMRTLLQLALVGDGGEVKWDEVHVPMQAVDPTRDRRAHVRRFAARLLGAPAPLLFSGETVRLRRRPQGSSAIYLDVSGSMGDWPERLHAALVPLRRLLAPRVFVFSTVVDELSRADFVRGRVPTTGGTNITPVLLHLAAEARAKRVRRALILTDGEVGEPDAATMRAFLATGAQLHVGLTANGGQRTPQWATSVTRLPPAGPECADDWDDEDENDDDDEDDVRC